MWIRYSPIRGNAFASSLAQLGFFASVSSQDGLSTTLAYHRLGTGRPETFQVSLTLGSTFVVVTEDEARSFLAAATG